MTDNHNKTAAHFGRVSQSILNGVVGDYLDQSNNPLAIEMGLYHRFNKIDLDSELTSQLKDTTISNKVVILVHGLTNLETIWDFPSDTANDRNTNYGTLLQHTFGYTPLFVRYNTGRDIESNGRELSAILESLCDHYPIAIDEMIVLGFSMGGLLLRTAQLDAMSSNKRWLKTLAKCFYIGTPHEGSPLEKAGYIAGEIVRHLPINYLNHWAEWIDIRSQGIKDLKLGLKPLSQASENQPCGSFSPQSEHYFISGSVGKEANSVAGKVFGDTLVRQGSAHPASKPLDSDHAHFANLPHIPLAHSKQVYQQIEQWLQASPSNIELKAIAICDQTNSISETSHLNIESHQAMLSGTVELLSDTAYKVVNTTETIHQSIAEVPFKILNKIPVLKTFTSPIEAVHYGISSSVYESLKAVTKTTKRGARFLSD
jgi:pimeloyl-ACP methyl ester carboxylesterase